MVVTHNLLAMNSSRQLGITTNNKKRSTEKLSSGYRINRSADDAAGLSMSEKMRWQVRGLNKAVDNCNAGADFCKISDGAMNEVSDVLRRMKELSVQAGNDTNTVSDRQAIQDELEELALEMDRIDASTEYNSIPVFAWERYKITSQGDNTNGWDVVDREVITVDGINYGITDVLGESNVYSGAKLNSPIQLGTSWVSTGHDKYEINTDVGYFNSIFSSNGINGGVADGTAVSRWNASTSYATQYVDYEADGIRLKFNYDKYIKNSASTYPAASVVVEKGTYYTDASGTKRFRKDSNVRTYNFVKRNSVTGSKGETNGQIYGCTWLDFSGLGRDYELQDLYGEGFNTKCATCSRPYSIRFTGDTCTKTTTDGVNYSFDKGNANCLTINISDCNSAADIVKHIMSAAGECTPFMDHYQQYAYDPAVPGKIYVYDNRESCAGGGASKFVPTSVTTSGQQIINDTVVHVPGTNQKISFMTKELWIQSGAMQNSGFYINRARCNSSFLGVDCLGVLDYDSASAAIDSVDAAINILNEQRSMMGSQQNRLECAGAVDANSAENGDAAESRIRDTDMAKEVMSFARHNILEQAGQAMLAQANQSTQGIFSLLG